MTEEARKGRPGMTDPEERLKDMDIEGIDVAVIFGTQIALTVNGLMDKGLAGALCHAVNEWMIEYCSADPSRLRAVGLIPCQDPPAAVRELTYLAEHGATTAMLPTNVYGRNMGDPMFDPIYAAAQELAMPLSVHPQTGHDGVSWRLRRDGSRDPALLQVRVRSHDRVPLRADDRHDAHDRRGGV